MLLRVEQFLRDFCCVNLLFSEPIRPAVTIPLVIYLVYGKQKHRVLVFHLNLMSVHLMGCSPPPPKLVLYGAASVASSSPSHPLQFCGSVQSPAAAGLSAHPRAMQLRVPPLSICDPGPEAGTWWGQQVCRPQWWSTHGEVEHCG